jgi:hypothetical protein
MTASRAAIVPVPPPGTVLLVVSHGERVGFVLVSTDRLCRSPDEAWTTLRRAWIRLAEHERGEHPDPLAMIEQDLREMRRP